ncbi:hypothetical protein MTQ10_24275 [Streptomyces sp. XM83C]|uniref:Uncharacterized protein n=1 Tax=Streptomyces thermocoprophilus TaxID=78356 RepID=A0ABV5V768_9ACTN|nr:hypothetical protein [Streptomyces sp. XM83C]MCK1822635.1 hypothetical protein [Streptomyces sp. XM83C]
MLWVAVSLLPLMSLLLLVLDRIEERLLDPAPRRHRRLALRRPFRLVAGRGRTPAAPPAAPAASTAATAPRAQERPAV